MVERYDRKIRVPHHEQRYSYSSSGRHPYQYSRERPSDYRRYASRIEDIESIDGSIASTRVNVHRQSPESRPYSRALRDLPSTENPDDDYISNALVRADRETAYKTLLAVQRSFVDPSQPVKTCFSVPLYQFSSSRIQQLWGLGIKPHTNASGIKHLKIVVYSQVTEPGHNDDLASYMFKIRGELEELMVKTKILQESWGSLDYLRAAQSAAVNHRDAIARLKRIYSMVYLEEWPDPIGSLDDVEDFGGLCSCGQMASRSREHERRAIRW